jgi:integrase
MGLSALQIEHAKAGAKLYRLFDGEGLFIEITPTGAKRWRVKYFLNGRERRLSLGIYPAVSLAQARERLKAVHGQVAEGTDPALAKAAAENLAALDATQTVEGIGREWYAKYSPAWADSHGSKVLRRLERYIFPWLGKTPIRGVQPLELLACLQRIEKQGRQETAKRTLQAFGRVMRYAVATGRAERDFTRDLQGALAPVTKKRRATLLDPKAIGGLLAAIDGYDGSLVTRAALKLAPLVFVRPGELRQAEWSDFDFEKPEWRIPPERMKMRVTHLVPLARQAVVILEDLKPVTGRGKYVFPSEITYDRPMSNNTLNSALRRLGYQSHVITPHGFRAMASTLLNEQGWNRDAIERQLAHMEHNDVRAAYNYADYLVERRKMMQAWADYLNMLFHAAQSPPAVRPKKRGRLADITV